MIIEFPIIFILAKEAVNLYLVKINLELLKNMVLCNMILKI